MTRGPPRPTAGDGWALGADRRGLGDLAYGRAGRAQSREAGPKETGSAPLNRRRTPIRCPVPGALAACLLPPHSLLAFPSPAVIPARVRAWSPPCRFPGEKDTLCRGRGLLGGLALEVPSRVGRSGELFAGRGGFLGRRGGG